MNIRAKVVFGCVLIGLTRVGPAQSETPSPTPAPASAAVHKTSPYHGMKLSEKARAYYPAAWGVDHLRATYTSSGNLIRFSYRVVEPKLAKALGDHESTPYLYAPRSHAMLSIPTMEKIGQLRQLGAS
jgi:hypothetical protein